MFFLMPQTSKISRRIRFSYIRFDAREDIKGLSAECIDIDRLSDTILELISVRNINFLPYLFEQVWC